MQRHKIRRQFCNNCQTKTKFERHVTAMGCGDLVMVICTLGIWLIFRLLMTPGWRCSDCGSR